MRIDGLVPFSARNERAPKLARNVQQEETDGALQYIQRPEALDEKRCGSELCVQLARGIPRPRRLRIAIISPRNPNPISMRP